MIKKGLAAFAVAVSLAAVAASQAPAPAAGRAWMDPDLSPDARAELAVERMSRAEETVTIALPERRLPVGWRPTGSMGHPAP